MEKWFWWGGFGVAEFGVTGVEKYTRFLFLHSQSRSTRGICTSVVPQDSGQLHRNLARKNLVEIPSRPCMEVLRAFASWLTPFTNFYMMLAKVYLRENLTAAGTLTKFFYATYNIWMQQTYCNSPKIFRTECEVFHAHF